MDIVEKLQEMGLTKNQAKIYFLLQKRGTLTVLEISRLLRMPRSSVYGILKKLRIVELISITKTTKTSKARVNTAVSISDYVFRTTNPTLRLVDDLKEKYSKDIYSSSIYFYEKFTKEVHEVIWNKYLESKNYSFISIGKYELWCEYVMKQNREPWEDKARHILKLNNNRTLHTRNEYLSFMKDVRHPMPEFTEVDNKFPLKIGLIDDGIEFQCEISAYLDWFMLMTPLKEGCVLIVNSKSIADTFETFLNLFWEHSIHFNYREENEKYKNGLPTLIDVV